MQILFKLSRPETEFSNHTNTNG